MDRTRGVVVRVLHLCIQPYPRGPVLDHPRIRTEYGRGTHVSLRENLRARRQEGG